MKVLFITNLPSPYRVDFFNELGKKIDLTVCYERKSSKERNKNWVNQSKRNYKERFALGKPIGIDRSIGFGVIKELKKDKYDYIIISGFSSPSIILAIIYCQLRKINYIIEDDGGLLNKNGEKYKAIKKFLLRKTMAYFTTTDENIQNLLSLGVKRNKIFKYPFSSVKDKDIEDGVYKKKEIHNIRRTLNMKEKRIILSVGQFITRKGFDVLLKSFSEMPNDCGLYFVGGKPTKEYLDIVKKFNIKNVYFVGFKNKEELKEYYAAADIFVLPTREDIWGLVINEAMAAGLPIITTNRCGAGLELIKDNKNGFLTDVEDIKSLTKRMKEILYVDCIKSKMAEETILIIKKYTIEEMVKWHIKMLENLKNNH